LDLKGGGEPTLEGEDEKWEHQGRHPRAQGDRPALVTGGPLLRSSAFSYLLDSSFVYVAFLSLCKSDMWTSFGSFLITPYRNRHSPKLMEFSQCKPYIDGNYI
jgi:hypothetical protein